MTLGPLTSADETLHHQIADTFATVSQADHSWTEKICAMAGRRDGSVQVAFGLGKYPNRGVMDAYAGVSRGVEQWTVRASRRLAPELDRSEAGPIRYEVVEPLRMIRFSLAPNDVVPISFEWTFTGVVPAALEEPERRRSRDGLRLDADAVRYHHIGTAEGWIEVEGERHELTGATSVSTRDHSWGVRQQVGAPQEDLPPAPVPSEVSTTVVWSPILCERGDGSRYGLHLYYMRVGVGTWERVDAQGGIEDPDGRRHPFSAARVEADVDPRNRRLRGATIHATMGDGSSRPLTVTALGDTGFHLGTGLYFGFDGHWHGQWRGDRHVDGEHVEDCSEAGTARRLHQLRDALVRVEDPVGGGVGVGNMQTIFAGPHPDLGLDAGSSFL